MQRTGAPQAPDRAPPVPPSAPRSGRATAEALAERRAAGSPRHRPPPTPVASLLIHAAVLALWALLFARAFVGGGGLLGWSAGIAYIGYDTLLLGFVFVQTLPLASTRPAAQGSAGALPTATVIVAAHDEVRALPRTLAALLRQAAPAEAVLVADDGSTDGTAAMLATTYGFTPAAPGALALASRSYPTLRWLALPQGGKARALNRSILLADTELVMTIDADTLVEPDALAAMRGAFAADPALVAATGVLAPVCGDTASGRLLEWFQRYEYVRNFLSRYAWTRADGLLLISGAFACYRRDALLAVGGFDPDCLVEDYELTHRLRDHAVRHGLAWRTAVIGAAQARTEAPGTVGGFLRQRRRWFGGFLQTQFWYRHMVGNRRYGRLGTMMLPVKAIDTLQPLYGLTAAGLLLGYLAGGRFGVLLPVAGLIGAKLVVDLAFHLWSLHIYRRWLGQGYGLAPLPAILASLIEPFSFQLLRHAGAALGWVSFLRRSGRWGHTERAVRMRP